MDKAEIKKLVLEKGLTITDLIDVVVDINGYIGVGLISLGDGLKDYCYKKTRNFPEKKRIRMIVIDGHTFGYMDEGAKNANVLHASVLKGSTLRDGDLVPLGGRDVRTATVKDFEDFRVSVDGYLRDDRYIIER